MNAIWHKDGSVSKSFGGGGKSIDSSPFDQQWRTDCTRRTALQYLPFFYTFFLLYNIFSHYIYIYHQLPPRFSSHIQIIFSCTTYLGLQRWETTNAKSSMFQWLSLLTMSPNVSMTMVVSNEPVHYIFHSFSSFLCSIETLLSPTRVSPLTHMHIKRHRHAYKHA